MSLRCILSSYAFLLFFGIIGVFVFPSLLVFLLAKTFFKYPQDVFQNIASLIYKIFFKIFHPISLDLKILQTLPQSAIYVSSHESNLDYPILGTFLHKYLIMTNLKYKKIPFISTVGNLIGGRFIDSNNLDTIAKVYNEFEKNLEENRNLIFFAEGTRNKKAQLKRFKKGAFKLAMKLDKPIVPILLLGSGDILEKGSFCFSSTQKKIVKVRMLEAIYPKDFQNDKALLSYTYDVMQKAKDKALK